MKQPRLATTTIADQPLRGGQKSLWPVNVCAADTASCLTARMWKDGWTNFYSLGHFPSTAILIEYNE